MDHTHRDKKKPFSTSKFLLNNHKIVAGFNPKPHLLSRLIRPKHIVLFSLLVPPPKLLYKIRISVPSPPSLNHQPPKFGVQCISMSISLISSDRCKREIYNPQGTQVGDKRATILATNSFSPSPTEIKDMMIFQNVFWPRFLKGFVVVFVPPCLVITHRVTFAEVAPVLLSVVNVGCVVYFIQVFHEINCSVDVNRSTSTTGSPFVCDGVTVIGMVYSRACQVLVVVVVAL
ncbi:hypothetical protein BCR42DRAFT_387564 [Absidia repens]|uniref:Transmembrane protein n=1 Tax=Absidia repens TaxID=90262 RepID=A0A1X2IV98_9FUNG|nr:hypothetical protein BCR42DRAFT_387564 [Absidia repens]